MEEEEEEEELEAGAATEGVVLASFLVTLLLTTLVTGSGVATSLSGIARTGLCTSETRYWHTETAAA